MARVILLFATLTGTLLLAQSDRDRAIESDIQKRLEKSVIGKEGFQVQVRAGVAYWTGQTAVPQRKGAATRMAKSAGAAKVVNNIRVTTAKANPPKASQPRTASPTPRSEPPPPPPRRVKVQWRAVRP